MISTRVKLESIALEPFVALVVQRGLTCAMGQGVGNRVALEGNVYFQFGDLRVDLPSRHLIVEVESAGGVTNLVKYWQCLDKGMIKKPVFLLHLFRQVSVNDYRSHIELWRFLAERMSQVLPGHFRAELYTYRADSLLSDLKPALDLFNDWLCDAT